MAESIRLILSHTGFAGAMMLIFAAGCVFAFPVRRWRIRILTIFAETFAARVARILNSGSSRLRLGTFIFLFNALAIFLYMLTGIVPWLPALTTFLTGMNVVLASIMGGKDPATYRVRGPMSPSGRLCMLLTFALELPAFWYAMAMSWTIRTRIPDILAKINLESIQERIIAYAMILVPILAISAFAEAHAIVSSLAPHEPHEDT